MRSTANICQHAQLRASTSILFLHVSYQAKVCGMARPTHTDRSRRVGSGSNLFDSAASFGRASQRCHIGRPVHKNVQITSKNISIHFYHFFKNDNMYVHVDMLIDYSSSSSKLCILEEVNWAVLASSLRKPPWTPLLVSGLSLLLALALPPGPAVQPNPGDIPPNWCWFVIWWWEFKATKATKATNHHGKRSQKSQQIQQVGLSDCILTVFDCSTRNYYIFISTQVTGWLFGPHFRPPLLLLRPSLLPAWSKLRLWSQSCSSMWVLRKGTFKEPTPSARTRNSCSWVTCSVHHFRFSGKVLHFAVMNMNCYLDMLQLCRSLSSSVFSLHL